MCSWTLWFVVTLSTGHSVEVGSSSRDLTPRVTIQSHSGSCGIWISLCFKRVLHWHDGARQRKQHPQHYRVRMIWCGQTSAHKSGRIILSHHQLCPGYVCNISLEDVRWYGKTDSFSTLNDNCPLISWFLNQPIKMHAWLLWIKLNLKCKVFASHLFSAPR